MPENPKLILAYIQINALLSSRGCKSVVVLERGITIVLVEYNTSSHEKSLEWSKLGVEVAPLAVAILRDAGLAEYARHVMFKHCWCLV